MDHITKVLRLKKPVKCKTDVISASANVHDTMPPSTIGKYSKKLILDNSRWEASHDHEPYFHWSLVHYNIFQKWINCRMYSEF